MRQLQLITAANLPSQQVFGRDLALEHYRRYLGGNRGDVFYDASGGLFANAFAAIAGSICAGHHCYLYLPESYPDGDPDHKRLLAHGEAISACDDYFNRRLRRLAAQQNECLLATAECAVPEFIYPKPQVLLGRRGSGKTHYLIQKIRFLAQHSIQPLLLVSAFPEIRQYIAEQAQAPLLLLPPDEALRDLPTAAALFVDEAAALAPMQLLALCAHYPAFTLASSTDGYEGSAQNFLLKTLPALALTPEHIHHFQQGHRYQIGDALDTLLKKIFLFNTTTALVDTELAQIRYVDRHALFNDERLLCSVWALLNQAHYRSRPEDLKRLLDLPDQALFIAQNQFGECLAALQIIIETPLSLELAQALLLGRRRPRGRLLMQQLIMHSGELAWAGKTLARVQRIAVHEACRRKHYASALLDYAERMMPEYVFGTVHSDSEALRDFWTANGYQAVHQAPVMRSRHHGVTMVRVKRKK